MELLRIQTMRLAPYFEQIIKEEGMHLFYAKNYRQLIIDFVMTYGQNYPTIGVITEDKTFWKEKIQPGEKLVCCGPTGDTSNAIKKSELLIVDGIWLESYQALLFDLKKIAHKDGQTIIIGSVDFGSWGEGGQAITGSLGSIYMDLAGLNINPGQLQSLFQQWFGTSTTKQEVIAKHAIEPHRLFTIFDRHIIGIGEAVVTKPRVQVEDVQGKEHIIITDRQVIAADRLAPLEETQSKDTIFERICKILTEKP